MFSRLCKSDAVAMIEMKTKAVTQTTMIEMIGELLVSGWSMMFVICLVWSSLRDRIWEAWWRCYGLF